MVLAESGPKFSSTQRRKIVKVRTGYEPRALQGLIHKLLRRFNVLVCHRRFGKTVFAINEMIHQSLKNQLRNPQYAYIAPTYKQAKTVAWQYLVDYTSKIPGVTANKSELTIYIERPGRIDPKTGEVDPDIIKIMCIGADDPDSLRGIYLDGGIIDEYAQCDPIIWGEIIRPALADRSRTAIELGIYGTKHYKEPWVIFIGTPKGQNHFFDRYTKAVASEEFCREFERNNNVAKLRERWERIEREAGVHDFTPQTELDGFVAQLSDEDQKEYKDLRKYLSNRQWYTALYKASETGVISRSEYDEMVEDLTKEQIEQELECSFTAAILGSFYGATLNQARDEGRVGHYPYDPRYPVDTYWDIGIDDKTTIWFRQKIRGVYRYIDYFEYNGEGVEFYAKVLEAKQGHYKSQIQLKDDVLIKGRGFRYGRHVWPHDANKREFGSGETILTTARSIIGKNVEIQPRGSVVNRIDSARNRIKIAEFDEVHCKRGLECLYNYQKQYDSKLKIFKKTPLHDWSSHGADSFGYSALDDRDSFFPDDRDRQIQAFAQSDYDELSA